MLKFFFADVDHINEGLVKRIKMRESNDFRRKKKLKLGVSTCILGFHDFQASILENAGTCYITVMYWYCPHMHVVILDCLKANWPKFSPYSCQFIWTADDLYAFTEYEGVHVRNCYIKMWNHYNSPLPRCRGHQSSGYVCWPLEGERCPRCHEIYSILLDFFCGVLFYMKFCSFFFFFSFFNGKNCLIYNFGFIF